MNIIQIHANKKKIGETRVSSEQFTSSLFKHVTSHNTLLTRSIHTLREKIATLDKD